MPQDYNWVDDYSPSTPNWVDDPTPSSKPFSWSDFLSGSIPETTTKPTDYSPGTYAPGEAHVPFEYASQPSSYTQGLLDIPTSFYNQANEAAKQAIKYGKEGDYESAFGAITAPVVKPITSLWELSQPELRNIGSSLSLKGAREPTPEEREAAKQRVIQEALGIAGLPGQEFQEAWEAGDYPRLAGQATSGLLMLGGGHAIGEAFRGNPPRPIEAAPIAHGPEPPAGFYPRTREWIEAQTPEPVYGPEISPYGTRNPIFGQQEFGFNEPVQGELGLGPYRAPSGRMTKTGPSMAPKMGPEVGVVPEQRGTGEAPWLEFYPEQGDLLRDLYKQPTPTPAPVDAGPMWPAPAPKPVESPFVGPQPEQPNLRLPVESAPPEVTSPVETPGVDPNAPIFSTDKTTVTVPRPDRLTVGMLKNQGYVTIPDLRSPDGKLMLVRGDVAPQYLTGDKRPPTRQGLGSERGSVQLEPDEVPREGAMTIPSEPPPVNDVGALRQQNLLTPSETTGPMQLDSAQTSMEPVRPPVVEPVAPPVRPQYPPGPLKPGETHQSRLAESRRKVREELDSFIEHGDDTPAEMRTTGIVDKIKDVATRLIKDETGTFNLGEAKRRIRELADRGDEIDDASPRQRENDTREVSEATTIERAREIRNAWRDRIALMTDRELLTPEGQHVRSMLEASRQRVIELLDVEEQAAQAAANRSYAQSDIGRQRDLEQITNTHDIRESVENRNFWQREVESDTRSGDAEQLAHSQRMLEQAHGRLQDLGEGDWEVFDYGTGAVRRRFHTETQARQYVNSHPSAGLDFDNVRNPGGPSVIVYDAQTGQVVARFDDMNGADRFIGRQPRPSEFGSYDNRHTNEPYTEDFDTRVAETEARHPDESIHQWEPLEETELPPAREWTPPPPEFGPSRPTSEQRLAGLRVDTGDLFPPVTEGLQPRTRGVTRPSPEQIRRLEAGADPRTLREVRQAYEKIDAWRVENRARRKQGLEPLEKPKTILDDKNWDQTMNYHWQNLPIDPNAPGLTIKKPYTWSDDFDLEYRGPDGMPVGVAKVRKTSEAGIDFRYVPTLAINREAGGMLPAKAFGEIGNALTKMNALDTGQGIISQHTARIIADLVRLLKDDAGYVDISAIMDQLKVLKEKVVGKTKNVMDAWAEMAKHMPGKRIDVKWMAEKTGIGKGESAPFDPVQWVREKTGIGMGEQYKKTAPDEINLLKEALNVPKNATTMLDLSFPGRQGLPLIATPEFWGAATKMFGALHYDTWKKMDAELRSKDIMIRPKDPVTGKEGKSFAEQIGTKIFSPASEPGPHAEAIASRWLEMGIGKGIGSKVWQYSAGYPIRAMNRAFLHALNHLNINRTEKLLNLARDMSLKGLTTGRMPMEGVLGGIHLPEGGNFLGFTKKVTPEQALESNPYHNLVRGKEIADFVNTATGHGPLKTHFPLPHRKSEISLESATDKLGYVLFSPGLLASRIRMMNPNTYIMASPFVRKQYLKAAVSTAAAWFVAAQMVKKAAGPEAEVGDDPTSADFGKVRIGDARMDLSGGFTQFATAYARAYVGGATSSSTGQFHRFGSGYQANTQEDMMERFFVNKLNPTAKFAYDWLSASEYKPFHVGDRTVQMFIPLFAQDLHEIAKENPDLLPLMGTTALFGGGTQIYGTGESVSKFIEPESDWNITGGGVKDVMPWNWGVDPGQERNFPWSEER